MKNTLLLFIFLLSFPIIGLSQWVSVSSGTSEQLFVVDFIDSQTGYCSTGARETYKTTDGGNTWSKVLDQGFYDFSFFNESFGFATSVSSVYEESVFKTNNGGNDWIRLTRPTSDQLKNLFSTSETTAYFAGGGGALYKTIDGGDTFSALNSGTDYYISDIQFTNTTTGYFISMDRTLKKSIDSGNTWNTIYNFDKYLEKIFFVNQDVGFIIGFGNDWFNVIWKTENGGETWNVETLNTERYHYVRAIDFYDENHGIIVGDLGTIRYTENGGETWIIHNSGTNEYLRSVKMTSPTTAVAVGSNGTILKLLGTLGSEDKSLNQNFTFFPNPVENRLTIRGIEEMDSVQVYNVLGKLLYVDNKIFSENYSVDFSTYSKGIYFLKISDEKGNATVKKVIKE